MPTYFEVNDTIKGDKIVCEARKIDKTDKINKTGRHKAQRTTLRDNARCTIIKKARFIGKTSER